MIVTAAAAVFFLLYLLDKRCSTCTYSERGDGSSLLNHILLHVRFYNNLPELLKCATALGKPVSGLCPRRLQHPVFNVCAFKFDSDHHRVNGFFWVSWLLL